MVSRLRTAALRNLKTTRKVDLDQIAQDLQLLVQQSMVLAYLEAAPKRSFAFARDNAYTRAVEVAAKRANMDPQQVERLAKKFGPQAAKVVQPYTRVMDQKLRAAFETVVKENMHVREANAYIAEIVDGAFSKSIVQTMVRDQINLSYMTGRMEFNAQPEIQEILWGYEYSTVGDDRVRPSHAALDGVRLPKDDPFWKTNMPPNGFNCRCTVIEIYNYEDAEEVKPPAPQEVDGELITPGADDGWGFNPGEVFNG